MLTISIKANSISEYFAQVQNVLGGELTDYWGEYVLDIDNQYARGSLRYREFEWGASVFDYDIVFHQPTVFRICTIRYNPIHFVYCLEGHSEHRFGHESETRKFEQFQSVIVTGPAEGFQTGEFPAGVPLKINSVRIDREKFISNRLQVVETLNQRLYDVFHDVERRQAFAYQGSYNLALAPLVEKLYSLESRGLIRIMQIEGLILQILSAHIMDHEESMAGTNGNVRVLSRELMIVRDIARQISEQVAGDYSLPALSKATGLSQYKLQEGFKSLYTRTVADYVRHVRLETARNLLRKTDMNISEVVYSVGFNSRSYFSNIFKKQYGLSPSDFISKLRRTGSD